MPHIVVIGAGVSGLTTALLLSKNPSYRITILAKHMPGDYDIEYTSPWAGANYLPMASEEGSRYEKATWPELARLAQDVPESGIHFQDAIIYNRKKDLETMSPWLRDLVSDDPWFASVVPNFRSLTNSELPPGIDSGTRFRSVCINPAIYLPWLVSQNVAAGVVLQRAVLRHISEVTSRADVDLVVNCTGLMASKLGGVEDQTVVPARGQIVIVRNSPGAMYTISGTDDGYTDDVGYIMERAAGGGTVLGGTYAKGSWESQADPNIAVRIMKRAIQLCPSLVKPGEGIEGLSIVRHAVGLRPLREAGVRIEVEEIDGNPIVHNYGHAGWGYQASYGCSQHAVELIDAELEHTAIPWQLTSHPSQGENRDTTSEGY